jgi:hypothetical protein
LSQTYDVPVFHHRTVHIHAVGACAIIFLSTNVIAWLAMLAMPSLWHCRRRRCYFKAGEASDDVVAVVAVIAWLAPLA